MHVGETAGNMLREINDELGRRANNALRGSGLTLSQVGVLMRLREAPDGLMTMSDLSAKFRVTQPTMSGLVRRLEKKGLVRVLGDPADRRIRNVLITQRGRTLCDEGERSMQRHEEFLLSGLTEEERVEFLRLLAKVRDDIVG